MRKASEYSPETTSIVADGPIMRPVISGQGATRTLLQEESGSLCLFDRAAGIVYTLPTPVAGLYFDFIVLTTITSNAAKISIDGSSGAFFLGSLVNVDTDTSNAVAAWTPNGSSNDNISMNGTTTGAIRGTRIRVTALSSGFWNVEGVIQGSGTVATPFSDS